MNMRTRALLFAFLPLIGCSYANLEKRAPIEFISSHKPYSKEAKIRLHIPSTTGAVVPGRDPSYMFFVEPRIFYSELAAVELRRDILELGHYRVFGDSDAVAEYVIKIKCSEFSDDVSAEDQKMAAPMLEAGILLTGVLSRSSGVLPGVGALVSNFETLSGLALSRGQRDRIGVVKIDFQIFDSNGMLADSFSYPVSFAIRVVESGGVRSLSEHKVVASSTPNDAVSLAAKEASKRIDEFLRTTR